MPTTGAETAAPLPERDIRTLLRESTRDLHIAVEATPVLHRLMGPAVTADDYRHLLGRLHGFHAPLEEQLLAGCEPGEWPPFQPRAERLARDLGTRGTDTATLPRCPHVPSPRSRAGLLGMAWVLEGSALGAQVIRRHLVERLGADVIGPFHGEEDPAAWRAFLALLEGYPWGDAERADAIHGARATFGSLLRWLEEDPVG